MQPKVHEQTVHVVQKLHARRGLSLIHTSVVAQSHCAVVANQVTYAMPHGDQ